jgi:hypothetical protein
MALNEHKSPIRRTGAPAPQGKDLWQYVPDPARTVLYILIAVALFTSAQWVPQFAGQMERSTFQQRIRDSREQLKLEYEQWREEDPRQAQQSEQRWAAVMRQADQEAEAEFKLAHPRTPMPAPSSESTTPPCLN